MSFIAWWYNVSEDYKNYVKYYGSKKNVRQGNH